MIYETSGTCSRMILTEVDADHIIKKVEFVGGCAGNTQGIQQLVIGQKAEDIIATLEGTLCGSRATSCPDQLSKALRLELKALES